jgi:hypothetical protein
MALATKPCAVPVRPAGDVRRRRHQRPQLSEVGFNKLGLLLLTLNGGVLVIDVLLFAALHLSIQWSTFTFAEIPLVVLSAVWLNLYLVPGGSKDRIAAEIIFIVGLIVMLSNVVTPMQYGSVALGSPYADPWLASADATMRIYVPTLAAWTMQHPTINTLLKASYASFLPQIFVGSIVLATYRDRAQLWEFVFHLHLCLVTAVAALMIFPAVCPPAYYGFQPTVNMTHLIEQIRGFHAGTLRVLRFDQLEGLVSFPSFHVAGALIVSWAVRHRRWIFVPIAVLNAALIASTVMTGVHYAVDAVASVPLFAFSVVVYKRWAFRLLQQDAHGVTIAHG